MSSEKLLYSEAPINISPKAVQSRITFAEVAMRFIQDIPLYILLSFVGIMAIRGTADARDFIITGLGSLLAKSWPKAIDIGNTRVNGVLPIAVAFGGLAKCLFVDALLG